MSLSNSPYAIPLTNILKPRDRSRPSSAAPRHASSSSASASASASASSSSSGAAAAAAAPHVIHASSSSSSSSSANNTRPSSATRATHRRPASASRPSHPSTSSSTTTAALAFASSPYNHHGSSSFVESAAATPSSTHRERSNSRPSSAAHHGHSHSYSHPSSNHPNLSLYNTSTTPLSSHRAQLSLSIPVEVWVSCESKLDAAQIRVYHALQQSMFDDALLACGESMALIHVIHGRQSFATCRHMMQLALCNLLVQQYGNARQHVDMAMRHLAVQQHVDDAIKQQQQINATATSPYSSAHNHNHRHTSSRPSFSSFSSHHKRTSSSSSSPSSPSHHNNHSSFSSSSHHSSHSHGHSHSHSHSDDLLTVYHLLPLNIQQHVYQCYMMHGNIHIYEGNYPQAYASFIAAFNCAKSMFSADAIETLDSRLSCIEACIYMKQYDTLIDDLSLCWQLIDRLDSHHSFRMLRVYYLLCVVFHEMQDNVNVLDNATRMLTICLEHVDKTLYDAESNMQVLEKHMQQLQRQRQQQQQQQQQQQHEGKEQEEVNSSHSVSAASTTSTASSSSSSSSSSPPKFNYPLLLNVMHVLLLLSRSHCRMDHHNDTLKSFQQCYYYVEKIYRLHQFYQQSNKQQHDNNNNNNHDDRDASTTSSKSSQSSTTTTTTTNNNNNNIHDFIEYQPSSSTLITHDALHRKITDYFYSNILLSYTDLDDKHVTTPSNFTSYLSNYRISILRELILVYLAIGDYDNACIYQQFVCDILEFERLEGIYSLEYARVQKRLGDIYVAAQQPLSATQAYKLTLSILNTLYGIKKIHNRSVSHARHSSFAPSTSKSSSSSSLSPSSKSSTTPLFYASFISPPPPMAQHDENVPAQVMKLRENTKLALRQLELSQQQLKNGDANGSLAHSSSTSSLPPPIIESDVAPTPQSLRSGVDESYGDDAFDQEESEDEHAIKHARSVSSTNKLHNTNIYNPVYFTQGGNGASIEDMKEFNDLANHEKHNHNPSQDFDATIADILAKSNKTSKFNRASSMFGDGELEYIKTSLQREQQHDAMANSQSTANNQSNESSWL